MKIEPLLPPSSAPLHRKGRTSGNGASFFASQATGDVAGPRSVPWATADTAVDDPRLGDVAEEIELQAALELAKPGRRARRTAAGITPI